MLGRNRAAIRDLRVVLLLAALSVGFLWRSTLTGKVMLPGDLLLIMEPWDHYSARFPEFHRVGNPILDAVQQFYPWRKFAGESLRRGEVPLWNPYELCGNPFVGNNQSAVFYPETWLHALMPPARALAWATALYFFLSGSLMFWFLRTLGLRRGPGLLGAIAFMFNGFVIGWLCFPSFRSVPGWLPGMLVGVEWMLRGRRWGGVALCGFFTGMQFLAGNLHISVYVLLVFGAYGAARCAAEYHRGRRNEAAAAAAGTAVALVLGGALASAQLLPTLELAGMSSRSAGSPYHEVVRYALAPQTLLTALMPDLFGNPVDYNHWGAELGKVYRAYTETAFYVGVAPLALLLPALTCRRRQAWFWLGVAGAGALLAIGSPLNAVLYHVVPSFKRLTGIGRAVVMMSLALPVLGALGAQHLTEAAREDPARGRQVLFLGVLLVAMVGATAGLWVWIATGAFERQLPDIGSYTLVQVARFALFLAGAAMGASWVAGGRRAGMAVLVVCLCTDLYVFVAKFTPATPPAYLQVRPKLLDAVRSVPGPCRLLSLGKDSIHRMSPNTPMILGIEDIQGSDSLEIGAYRRLLTAASTNLHGFLQPDYRLPLIDLLNVRFVYSSFMLPSLSKLRLVDDAEGFLYVNHAACPRAFVVPSWKHGTAARVLRAVTSPDFRPRQVAWFIGARLPPRPLPASHAAPPLATRSQANRVTVRGPFRPGQLVLLADSWYPGWRAYQGRRRLAVLRADYALTAVQTATRGRTIRFVYFPQSYRVGMYLTLLSLGMILGLASAGRATRRGNP